MLLMELLPFSAQYPNKNGTFQVGTLVESIGSLNRCVGLYITFAFQKRRTVNYEDAAVAES